MARFGELPRPKRTLSLEDAAREAWRLGILAKDYYALTRDEEDAIFGELMPRTRWKQSPSSAAQGRSKRYSFYLALQDKRVPVAFTPALERAHRLVAAAIALWQDGLQAESSDAYEVAADALNEAEDHRGASYARKSADNIRRYLAPFSIRTFAIVRRGRDPRRRR